MSPHKDSPHLTPELNQRIREEESRAGERKLLGTIPCLGYVKDGYGPGTPRHKKNRPCQKRALVYDNDWRARGWLRYECEEHEDHWGDLMKADWLPKIEKPTEKPT